MNSTRTDHRLQTEKPTCSEKIEKMRLRRAVFFPVTSQNAGSSGRQSWIHLPVGTSLISGGAAVVVIARPSVGPRQGVAAVQVEDERGSSRCWRCDAAVTAVERWALARDATAVKSGRPAGAVLRQPRAGVLGHSAVLLGDAGPAGDHRHEPHRVVDVLLVGEQIVAGV